MLEPNFGDTVTVRPRNGLRVQVDGIFGRFIPDEGAQVIWSEHWHRRFRDGSIEIVPPRFLSDDKDAE